MKKKNYLIIISIVAIIGIILTINPLGTLKANGEAEGRIAYVDVQAVFNAHPDKAASEEKLNNIAQSMQSELEKKAKNISGDEQKKMLNDYQDKLSAKEQELIQGILDKIDKAIKKVGEEKGVKMVLNKKTVIYGGYDMTQDVIDYIKAQQENSSDNSASNNTEKTKK